MTFDFNRSEKKKSSMSPHDHVSAYKHPSEFNNLFKYAGRLKTIHKDCFCLLIEIKLRKDRGSVNELWQKTNEKEGESKFFYYIL